MNGYRATDRRCYNGCPSSDLRREWDATADLDKQMKELDRTAGVTYFPMESKYLAFRNSNILENPDLVGPPEILTGNFWHYKQDCILEAIHVLKERQT